MLGRGMAQSPWRKLLTPRRRTDQGSPVWDRRACTGDRVSDKLLPSSRSWSLGTGLSRHVGKHTKPAELR